MKNLVLTVALLLSVFADTIAQASFQNLSISQAVNIAARQRMLTQRMAKGRVFRSMGVQAEQAQKEINNSIVTFEETLKNLMAYSPNKKIKEKFERVEKVWPEYKAALLNDSSKNSAIFVVNNNTRILTLCDEAVQELIVYSKTLPSASDDAAISPAIVTQYTNVSGKTRLLSQRLTLYYGAHYSDLDKDASKQLKVVADNIQACFSTLMACEINTTDIDDALAGVLKDWETVREKCYKGDCFDFENKTVDPIQMYDTCNKILSKMDKVTAMYASLLK
jgi:Type IV pili methyl-accepting chemotaxis transducer N-term